MNTEQQAFLNTYLATLSDAERQAVPETIAEYFCADEYNANECARLIDQGIKRASCSLKACYEIENEPYPQVGRLTVVLNWAQQPVCIIKVTEVSECPFDQVTAEFAAAEGEGDKSYAWWRQAHLAFFEQEGQALGVPFTTQSPLVLERFKKVYPLDNHETEQVSA
ncbi:RNA-binding protein [Salinivibrio kushneri]|uniref:RNA-binding protein n=1 Tax=Salinivibrio kushneri TaxID=1908198 RepID=A0AB36K525_9GAMM|nr:ASCH domain-containing protein [Salinivibrio kushneri]OOE40233.1 RNA-binding protein [Salinivibrio kushneri]OOE43091.1 RNA-binding protein [Salinivibrio kushneri]